jgi:hypothetical protein
MVISLPALETGERKMLIILSLAHILVLWALGVPNKHG